MSDSAANEKMKNPYEDGVPRDEVRLSRGLAWGFVGLFLLLCVGPPVWRNLFDTGRPAFVVKGEQWRPAREIFRHPSPLAGSDPTLGQHLRSFEGQLEKAEFREGPAKFYQALTTRVFGNGGGKVHVGRQGILFYQPGLDSLTGYGPLRPEPDTVAKDPNRVAWRSARGAVLSFHEQLRERGIELVLVPVPIKPMIHPEHAGARPGALTGPVRHPDSELFFAELRENGIEVLDLADAFFAQRRTPQFLKQDTHWTPEAMERSAAAVAEVIESKPWFTKLPRNLETSIEEVERSHHGDLAEMLFGTEQTTFPSLPRTLKIPRGQDGEILSRDPDSPVVVIGDSFVNIFHDPQLGYGDPEAPKDRIGAGFAQHLAARLKTGVDVHAVNGQGASGARDEFGTRFDDEIRAKKIVLWVLASRDLFLSETAASANKANVEFTPTVFNPRTRPARIVTPAVTETSPDTGSGEDQEGDWITARMMARSANPDPTSTPYTQAIYTAHFETDEASAKKLGLEFSDAEFVVRLWSFQDRQFLPTSAWQEGKRYRLKLIPKDAKPELDSVRLSDDRELVNLFLDEFYAVEGEVAP